MATVKTSISMPDGLFNELNAAAEEMQFSRSKIFVLAVKKFLRERENQRILEQLNRVYGEEPDEEERNLARAMKTRLQTMADLWPGPGDELRLERDP